MTGASQLSYRHQRVQRLRRLLARRSVRESERAFVVEGAKVLSEALAAGVQVEGVYVAPDTDDPVVDAAHAAGVRLFELEAGVLERSAGTVTPQPVMAVVPMVDVAIETLRRSTFLVVCVDVRDPGNLGTVLRSAEASGADGVVCCSGSVDVYNPKTVRASAGSLFHVPIVAGGDPLAVLEQIGDWGLRRDGAAAHDGRPHTDVDLTAPVALVLGNEASGLAPEIDAVLDEHITIGLAGRSESLNVSMAATVMCFEVTRQRRAARA